MWQEWADALEAAAVESKLFDCGGKVLVCPGECDTRVVILIPCQSRLCPFCERSRSAERVGLFRALAEGARSPRLLTLTAPLVPYTVGALRAAIERRRRAFTRLRRSRVLAAVKGGIYAFEVTLRRSGFHLHLHALIDAAWVENREECGRELETRWRECLAAEGEEIAAGKRVVVDVRRADRNAVREVVKYVVKGALGRAERGASVHTDGKDPQLGPSDLPPEALRELVAVLEGGVHLLEPFGAWRGAIGEYRAAQEFEREEEDRENCPGCGARLIVAYQTTWRSDWWQVERGVLTVDGDTPFWRGVAARENEKDELDRMRRPAYQRGSVWA